MTVLTQLKGPASAQLSMRAISDNYNTPEELINSQVVDSYTFGSGAGQINKFYSTKFTIGNGATQSLILDDASLINFLNIANTFTAIKVIRIQHTGLSLSSDISIAGTFMVGAFGASFNHPLRPSGYYNTSDSDTGYTVGAGQAIDLINNDGGNEAIVTIDLFGV